MSTPEDTSAAETSKARPMANYLGAGLALMVMVIGLEGLLLERFRSTGVTPAWVSVARVGLLLLPWAVAIFLLGKRIKTGERYPWLAFAFGAALPWMVLFAFLFGPSAVEYMRRTDFDSADWKDAVNHETGMESSERRIRMVDDLMDSGVLDGKPRGAVRALLGPGDGRGEADCETYWLGPERGFLSIDSELLEIRYDEQDKVKRYWLRTD